MATRSQRPLAPKPAAQKKAAAKRAKASAPATAPSPVSRKAPTREEALGVFERLKAHHHDAHCELDHRTPFELICATVLSAQSTDVAVNKLTPALFEKFPDARALAAASQAEVEDAINRIGMYRQKAKNLIGLAKRLVAEHGGEVPQSMQELVLLPGVGRKTANVVLGVAFGKPEGVVVDTHVQRIAQRLQWTRHDEPVAIDPDLK